MKKLLILQLHDGMKNSDLRLISFFCCFVFASTLFGQNSVRHSYSLMGKTYAYYVMQPVDSIKGILILFPGKGENPKNIFRKTRIPEVLKDKGYQTIVPELHYSLFVDQLIKKQLKEILRIQTANPKLISPNLTLGGYSAGGSIAVSFAEYLLSFDSAFFLKSVFVIDPPLDLERFYSTAQKFRQYNCGNLIYREGSETLNFLENSLGSPTTSFKNYFLFSPFLASQPDGGNARLLKSIPIRLYVEPDIDFVKEKYCKDLKLEDLNVTDLEKLNQVLLNSGNKNAEYIVTKGRGYHSWNIVEPGELAEWILKFGN